MRKEATVQGIRCLASIKSLKELFSIRTKLNGNGKFRELSLCCSLLGNPTRFKIAVALLKEKDLCVCDLANILGVSVAAVSQHLKKLRNLRLIASKRRDQTLYYFFPPNPLKKFLTKIL